MATYPCAACGKTIDTRMRETYFSTTNNATGTTRFACSAPCLYQLGWSDGRAAVMSCLNTPMAEPSKPKETSP